MAHLFARIGMPVREAGRNESALDEIHRSQVIGGPGAFLIAVASAAASLFPR